MARDRHPAVWQLPKAARNSKFQQWAQTAVRDRAGVVTASTASYHTAHERLQKFRGARDAALLQTKRIVGCTTTAAAKNAQLLSTINPGIVIVEEAAEVLESHVLVSLAKSTKQLVLIGDHLQLRPKVNNFALTVDKKDGFDLDRSLFERLVISGYPLSTLVKQHRMRPEISTMVRRLMYPDLEDDEKTLSRDHIRGLSSDVVFFNHNQLEDEDAKNDAPDDGRKASRQNRFEAEIVLKTVKYLAQQGYGTDDLVVLTPYLGQLRLLMDRLKEEVDLAMDPVLSDIDSHDLVKAGLLTPAAAKSGRRKLTMSTIGMYKARRSSR
jgi:superfamily I DNA and/or RNA helicase